MLGLLPEISLLVLGFSILVFDLLIQTKGKINLMFHLGWIGTALISFFIIQGIPTYNQTYIGTYVISPLGSAFKLIFAISLFWSILLSRNYFKDHGSWRGKLGYSGEFYSILCFVVLGMFVIVSSADFLTLFIGLELATIPLYLLAGYLKKDKSSGEAGTKYIIIGSLSTAVFLFGVSFVYGAAGTLRFEEIKSFLAMDAGNPIFWMGSIFLLVSVGFKLSLAPFHLWAPDVYEGAPTPVTAFLSVGSKAAGISVLIMLFYGPFSAIRSQIIPAVYVLACLTMVVGNLGALRQSNLRRFMAYSSISQAGYLLVAFVGNGKLAVSSILFYLIVYAVSNFTVFFIISIIGQKRDETFYSLRGLSKQSPTLAMVLTLAMFSLAGIPPLAGFTGKFFLFASAAEGKYYALIIFAALNSTVSLYYYLLILKEAYIQKPTAELPPLEVDFTQRISLLLLTAGMLVLGLWPRVTNQILNIF